MAPLAMRGAVGVRSQSPIESGDTFSMLFPQLIPSTAHPSGAVGDRCIGCVARPQAITAGSRDRTNAVAFSMPISQYITAERALKNRDMPAFLISQV